MIVGIVGDMGSGKTLLMTALLLNDSKEKKGIFTNYNVKFPRKLLDIHEVENLFTIDLKSKISFGIDEMHIFMDSRSASKNRVISYWILQTRKRGIDLYYTTQYFHQIDRRLRNATLYKIECNNYGDEKSPNLMFSVFKRVEMNDDEIWTPIKDFIIADIHKYFKFYDTTELINPFEGKPKFLESSL